MYKLSILRLFEGFVVPCHFTFDQQSYERPTPWVRYLRARTKPRPKIWWTPSRFLRSGWYVLCTCVKIAVSIIAGLAALRESWPLLLLFATATCEKVALPMPLPLLLLWTSAALTFFACVVSTASVGTPLHKTLLEAPSTCLLSSNMTSRHARIWFALQPLSVSYHCRVSSTDRMTTRWGWRRLLVVPSMRHLQPKSTMLFFTTSQTCDAQLLLRSRGSTIRDCPHKHSARWLCALLTHDLHWCVSSFTFSS